MSILEPQYGTSAFNEEIPTPYQRAFDQIRDLIDWMRERDYEPNGDDAETIINLIQEIIEQSVNYDRIWTEGPEVQIFNEAVRLASEAEDVYIGDWAQTVSEVVENRETAQIISRNDDMGFQVDRSGGQHYFSVVFDSEWEPEESSEEESSDQQLDYTDVDDKAKPGPDNRPDPNAQIREAFEEVVSQLNTLEERLDQLEGEDPRAGEYKTNADVMEAYCND